MSALIAAERVGLGLFWFMALVVASIPVGVGIAIGGGMVVILALKFITWRSNQPKKES